MNAPPPLPATTKKPTKNKWITVFIIAFIFLATCIGSVVIFGPRIAINLLKGQIDSAKETRANSDLQAIGLALQSYEARTLRIPTTEQGLMALVEKPTLEPIPENYRAFMEELPKDPWGQPYKYRFPAQKSKKTYDLWTVGPDGQDGTDDDLGNWKKSAVAK
jgi:general secretion pathway protein G